jgi:hypothetical protein
MLYRSEQKPETLKEIAQASLREKIVVGHLNDGAAVVREIFGPAKEVMQLMKTIQNVRKEVQAALSSNFFIAETSQKN